MFIFLKKLHAVGEMETKYLSFKLKEEVKMSFLFVESILALIIQQNYNETNFP